MPKILVVGGGYAGFYTAWKLEKHLRQGEAEVVMVDPLPYMTYQPFLPEVAAGSIEPRHAVVAHRRHLKKTRVVTAKVTKEEFSNDVAKGSIIAQDPSSGTIFKGRTVNVVVSKGPDLVTVPQVSGLPVDQAVALLRQAGFDVDVRRFFGGAWGQARATEPSAGQQAGRGTTVVLHVV